MPDQAGSVSFIRAVEAFVFVSEEPWPCDVMFVPGSAHEEHVRLAAALYRRGLAPWILPSGRHAMGEERFSLPGYDSEWAWMRALLLSEGVPEAAILREDQATFTWDNARRSRAVTDALGLEIRRGMVVCRAPHARRALLYYQAAYPEAALRVVTAPAPGLGPGEWHRTPEGRDVVLGEVRRLGDQIKDVFADFVTRWPPEG